MIQKLLKHLTSCLAITSILCVPLSSCNNDKNQITITLDLDGGSCEKQSIKIECGSTFAQVSKILPTPTKTGFILKKWTFSDSSDISSSYKFNSNTTLLANWAESVSISLKVDDSLFKQVAIEKGAHYYQGIFPTPVKTGYDFKYWTIYEDEEWKQITESYIFNNDVELVAYFEISEDQKYINNLKLRKIENNIKDVSKTYLWEAQYDDYSEEFGEDYLQKFFHINGSIFKGSCSSFYRNGFVGRNFDWLYNDLPEVIIHTTANENRLGSVGIALAPNLTPSTITSLNKIYDIKAIPFFTVDGVNSEGVYASMNQIPSTDTEVGYNHGDGSSKSVMHEMRLVRYILDHATSVDNAWELIQNFNIYSYTMDELHIMIADKDGNCAEIEFEFTDSTKQYKHPVIYKYDGTSKFIGISTNFTFTGYNGDCDKWYESTSSLLNHSEGCERYNILSDELSKITSVDVLDYEKVLDILSKVYYSKTYTIDLINDTDNFWFSEYNYSYFTKATSRTISNYQGMWNWWKSKFNWNNRNGIPYVTRNSCAYDLNNCSFKMRFEEYSQTIDTEFEIEYK